jgi:hypothetical protein
MRDDVVDGILLIYHHRLMKNAPMILDHVDAFNRHSRFRTWAINTEGGFPPGLRNLRFRVLVLHYSLFGYWPYLQLSNEFLLYLRESKSSYKIAFFQDEYHFCKPRFDFINQFEIDCIYTLLEPRYFKEVYGKFTKAKSLVHTIPGYVSDQLLAKAKRLCRGDGERDIDIGYRGRPVMYYMGKGAQEKTEIAHTFRSRCRDLSLKLDIKTEENKRLYGDHWYKFLAKCRAVLGVEAGVSIFDLQDDVRTHCERMLAENPDSSFEDVSQRILEPWEENIYYRTISTRHFEAAAFKACQILFEGKYSGIMEPMVHFLPLKKDFSNFDDVIRLFRDRRVMREVKENAYRDLIASGKYSYKAFIDGFDHDLASKGFNPSIGEARAEEVTEALARGRAQFHLRLFLKMMRYYPFPGKSLITEPLKPLVRRYRRYRENRTGSDFCPHG